MFRIVLVFFLIFSLLCLNRYSLQMAVPSLDEVGLLNVEDSEGELKDLLEKLLEENIEMSSRLAVPPKVEFDIQIFLMQNNMMYLSGTRMLYVPPPELMS